MITHYLKVAFRNLLKYKTQTAISVLGLAIGFASVALSIYWNHYEMTYDAFQKNADRIYRVRQSSSFGGVSGITPGPLAEYLMHTPGSGSSLPHPLFKSSRAYRQRHSFPKEDLFLLRKSGSPENVRFRMGRRRKGYEPMGRKQDRHSRACGQSRMQQHVAHRTKSEDPEQSGI